MATHEHPPNFEMLHGCPTPPPIASSMHGPPRFLSQAIHTPPMYKRVNTPKPLHTPPLEFTPIGLHQFRFTRAPSNEQSSRPSSVSGHAHAGTALPESEYDDNSEEDSDEESEEDERPRCRLEEADFELEEVGSDVSDDETLKSCSQTIAKMLRAIRALLLHSKTPESWTVSRVYTFLRALLMRTPRSASTCVRRSGGVQGCSSAHTARV